MKFSTLFFFCLLINSTRVSAQSTASAPSPASALSTASGQSSAIFDYFFEDINAGYSNCVANRDLILAEKGFFVDVPVDYYDSKKGLLKIYAYFKNSFDPKKPTYLFFDGGPGGNSHNSPSFTLNYNELHFDQRGVGCSQPSNPESLLDFNFYSSESIARDAEAIRLHAKIEKVSVYGASYGSIPATIYAHFFSKSTTALLLEGVVFSEGNLTLSRDYIKSLEQVYSSLSAKTKARVDQYFRGARSVLFARIVRNNLSLNFGIENSRKYLELLFSISHSGGDSDEARITRALQAIPGMAPAPLERAISALTSERAYPNQEKLDRLKIMNLIILNCKENPENVKALSTEMGLQQGQFFALLVPRENLCETFHIPANARSYKARDYPIQIPVTYFQGYRDPRTQFVDAIKHLLRSAESQAQLLLAKEGGHGPFFEILANPPNSEVQALYTSVFEKSLRGEIITETLLQEMNGLVPLGWEQTLRDRNRIYKISPIVMRSPP